MKIQAVTIWIGEDLESSECVEIPLSKNQKENVENTLHQIKTRFKNNKHLKKK